MSRKSTQVGFTLVEVMVALAIIGVALGAAVQAVSVANNNAANLSQQTLARWVAMNQIVRVQMSGEWPNIGKTTGTEEMANATWHWQVEVIKTQDDRLRQLQAAAGIDKDKMQTTVTAYVHNRVKTTDNAVNTNNNNGQPNQRRAVNDSDHD